MMIRRDFACFVAMLLVLAAHGAPCQVPGQRVRVSTVYDHGSSPWLTGRMEGFHLDTAIVLLDDGQRRTVVLDAHTRLDRSTGTHNNAGLGLFAGMILGKAIGSTQDSAEDPDLASGLMSLMGGFLGLMVGFGLRTTNWARITPTAEVMVVPSARGLGLRISLPDWR